MAKEQCPQEVQLEKAQPADEAMASTDIEKPNSKPDSNGSPWCGRVEISVSVARNNPKAKNRAQRGPWQSLLKTARRKQSIL
ncbi:hypothetical protein H920_16268 [Fukomys damarensis]|uniref:Uncharacterized protein n=1 Tax=Fukomys damarensis TaxID=885580 RepID=A0A091CW29_FUKDA|nr:hypothetical protein H920_16268 [Fukomys damarensis]